MIEKLEVHHLRTLNALYKYGNTTQAAEQLNVSQQAISLQLKKMREILQDRLFVRSGHGVSPTPYAKIIEPHIREILVQINNIPLPASMTPESIDRTFVISATDYAQTVIVAELMLKLQELAPNVKLIIRNIEVASLTKLMQQGDTHLAFTSHGYVPNGLVAEQLFIEKYCCVTSKSLRFASEPVSLEELVKHNFIVTNPGIGVLTGSADAWFERMGYPRNVVVSAPSFFMTQMCLKHSNLIGFLPSRLLPAEGLVEVPLEKYPPGYEVVIAYPPGAKSDPFIRWVVQLTHSLFKSNTDAPRRGS